LFLEQYLDCAVERLVAFAFSRPVERGQIVEIGKLASNNGLAMIDLWAMAANDLGSSSEFAVATLTAPLRSMFARAGVPIVELAEARPEMLGASAAQWGSYYENEPRVCAGLISEGQAALTAYLARRARRNAA
jgi:hypothetical protein